MFINAASIFPSIFLSTANGLIFGLPLGILISWLAETVGVVISFLLMRYLFRGTAEKIIATSNSLKNIDEASGKNGLQWMAFARALPYFPSGILTAIGALSKISVRDYIIANLIGKFPSTALEVVIGHDIVNFKQNSMRLTVLVIVTGIVFLLINVIKNSSVLYLLISNAAVAMSFILLNKFIWTDKITALRQLFFYLQLG